MRTHCCVQVTTLRSLRGLSAVQGGPARREQTALFWFTGPFVQPSLPFSGSRKEGGACHWSETEGRLGTTESTPRALFADEKNLAERERSHGEY